MTSEQKTKTKFSRTITFKGMAIAVLTLLMLIPSCMVQVLIAERQQTRNEAVRKIDAKWSYAQTICGPVLTIPYYDTDEESDGKKRIEEHTFNVTPERLEIETELFPEERYYGIYKTILYKSRVVMRGGFRPLDPNQMPEGEIRWGDAFVRMGVSDLRGIAEDIKLDMNGRAYAVQASGGTDRLIGKVLYAYIDDLTPELGYTFECEIELKGSGGINYIPIGQTTSVSVRGAWSDPGFVGNYSPEYTLSDEGFEANWQILHFNRSIPDTWTDSAQVSSNDISFGVDLVETVDIYQQNMRSAKYALMFIALTFVVFFFVEVICRKRIHPIQYLLVGVALTLFYSLLLSISEPLGFGLAYLISSVATICLITGYASSIFRNRRQTVLLASILTALYIFLYVILQLEQVALLAGSVGLFIILGIIMYFARRVNWYNE